MRKTLLLFFLIAIGSGIYYFWPQISTLTQGKKEFFTLERHISAEEIMQREKEILLKNSHYTFAPPKLVYAPHLLLEVKYSKGKSDTEESYLLWNLTEGEMISNTLNWEKTSGFSDCIDANANRNDFEIIKSLSQDGGKKKKELILRKFEDDSDVVEKWISSVIRKKLVVDMGDSLRLHIARPNLIFYPKTNGALSLVSRPLEELTLKGKMVYSPAAVKRLCQNAFGASLCVRNEHLVYLPTYEITVQNPDGSFSTTTWNAFVIVDYDE